ncbi:MAG TPA: MFS transporter [Cerasibacillus sp.]|uniref:MFS transporter n=1 Tax=Cerasibacillus sp. TaxID=2498711 RepID=UPI002F3F5F1A
MTRMLYIIIVVSFLDTFIQLPIITPYAIDLGASHMLTGAIVAIYSLTNMIGNIVGGHFIDRFGRKRMLLFGVVSVAVILLFYPLAQTGMQLLIIRFLHGLAGGVLIPAAFAFIGDQTKKAARGKTMAFTGASIGIAAILGPAIGGAMAAKSKVEHVFIFVSILFAITAILIIKFVKDTYTTTDRGKASLKQFIPLLKNPLIMQASLAAFALMVSNGTLAFALPLKVEEISLTAAATGMLLSTFGITALIVFLTPINRVYDRFSPVALVLSGIVFIGASLVAVHYMTVFWTGFIAMIVYGFGFALIFPSMNRMVADATTESNRGKAYGVFYAFFSLGVVAGSTFSGIVSEYLGMPFVFSAIVMVTCGVVLFVIAKVRQKDVNYLH